MPSSQIAALRTLAGLAAGAITGFMVALAVGSLPAFFIPNDGGGGLGGGMMALFFVAAPVGVILGAITGAYAAERGGLRHCLAAMVVAMVAGVVIADAGSDAAMASSPPVPEPTTCTYQSRGTTILPGGSIVDVFKRRCPGRAPTIEVSLHPAGWQPADVGPGNALVLDASRDSADHPVLVFATAGPGSALTISYDARARIISQQASVNGVALRVVPDSLLQSRGSPQGIITTAAALPIASAAPATPPAPTTPAAPACVNVVREETASPTWRVRIFRRTCPGTPPTLEGSVVMRPAVIDPEAPGNAFVLDASGDTPGDSIVARVMRADSASLDFGYDKRARVIRAASRSGGIGIGLHAERTEEVRRGSFRITRWPPAP